jgi:hypothetical protein
MAVYQYAGAISLLNTPELNAEFDSCTFASNTAGAEVSSLRILPVRSTQPDFMCIFVRAQGGVINILRAVGRVVVTNCRFERNRMGTQVRVQFAHDGC